MKKLLFILLWLLTLACAFSACQKQTPVPQSNTPNCSMYHVTTSTIVLNALYYPWKDINGNSYNAGDNGVFYCTYSMTTTTCGGATVAFTQVGYAVKGGNWVLYNTNNQFPVVAYGDTIRVVYMTSNSIKVSVHFTPGDSSMESRMALKYTY